MTYRWCIPMLTPDNRRMSRTHSRRLLCLQKMRTSRMSADECANAYDDDACNGLRMQLALRRANHSGYE